MGLACHQEAGALPARAEGRPRVLVIIPAYNEEKSVGDVVRAVRRQGIPDVLVVNDGSSDGTAAAAAGAGAVVLNLPFNLGIGGAVQAGYLYALRHGYDVAVQVDGDGQHDPTSLERLLRPVLAGTADMALGSRFLEGPGTGSRRCGAWVLPPSAWSSPSFTGAGLPIPPAASAR
ncbi:MAG: glycosyltransferase family 2 protein [Bacillota bacterium]